MIDKQNYYHGAAVISILEHKDCKSIRKNNIIYIVNDNKLVLIKYTTKHRSPWIFTFSNDEINRLHDLSLKTQNIILAFVCAGDGICSICYSEFQTLLTNAPGWISINRKFGKQYKVSGTNGELKGKISVSRWPQIIFN